MLNSTRIPSYLASPERRQPQVRQQSGVHENGVREAHLAKGLNAHAAGNVNQRKKGQQPARGIRGSKKRIILEHTYPGLVLSAVTLSPTTPLTNQLHTTQKLTFNRIPSYFLS